jgi:hypothetical protein
MHTNKMLETIARLSPPSEPGRTRSRHGKLAPMIRTAPERWSVDAGDADVAVLDVPPALGRMRRFEVDVRTVVRCPKPTGNAWHALAVEIDGRQHWSRRIATSNPGQTDSLDYHCRVEVPEGAGLRVRALARVHGSRRERLSIEVEES